MLTYIAAALAIIGAVLNVRRRRAGFAIWSATNLYWVAHNAMIGEWAQVTIYIVNFLISAWGFLQWGQHKAKEEEFR